VNTATSVESGSEFGDFLLSPKAFLGIKKKDQKRIRDDSSDNQDSELE